MPNMRAIMETIPQDTRVQARKLASYIKSDASIAGFLGCPIEVVAYERSKLRNKRPIGTGRLVTASETNPNGAASRAFEDDAKRGSRLLLEALHRFYLKREGRAA